ncbi:helix-turn-helix transcriptional regulator [Mesorhizobium australafricanum]|uniref:LuxR C-terminal-related transcriptional regulator n=1 Tax=Mesorhizobium australafricanum TaxID=3072311 RepID=A0ABU4WWW5_9HYPH|nr:LuxR C-terminal-related transcriptional regulator [Mesorhizobium sp. VK3E]MDX8440545.1 LuxR C-terminal-related transcriptional regulator [Mesorhizobium sp. VK3E]
MATKGEVSSSNAPEHASRFGPPPFDLWNKSLGDLAANIGSPQFPQALAEALRLLAPFEMMNAFQYAPDGTAHDLFNEDIPVERVVIVDHYLAGAYLLDPFYDAVRQSGDPRLLVMRNLTPDEFHQTEYYRRHYASTKISDEVGFVLPLDRGVIGVLSLSRIGGGLFADGKIETMAQAAPVVCALAARHWRAASVASVPASGSRAIPRIEHQRLTRRENEIVNLLLKGHSSLSTALQLSLSPNTIKVHRRRIYEKLNLSSQAELFLLFLA